MGCNSSKQDTRRRNRRKLAIRDDDTNEEDSAFKVVIVGNKAVGKSCLVLRVTKSQFSDTHSLTIGAAFSAKTIGTPAGDVKLHLWDTAGEEMYRAMTRTFYRGAQACVLCYDITDRATFEALSEWLGEFRTECPDAIVALCGNKADLAAERKVSTEEAEAYMSENHLTMHVEASAKTNSNVSVLFEGIATRLLEHSGRR